MSYPKKLVYHKEKGIYRVIQAGEFDPNIHEDRDSITDWDRHGQTVRDYKYVRERIKLRVATEGFENLTLKERQLASKWFATTKENRDTVCSIEQQVKNGMIFHTSSTESRKKRSIAVWVEIYNRLSKEYQMILISNSYEVFTNYKENGVEGVESGDLVPGVYDFAQALPPFELTGLANQDWPVEGMEGCGELADRIMQILKEGEY